MLNWRPLLLGGPRQDDSPEPEASAARLARDATTLHQLFASLADLEAELDALTTDASASRRGYFTPTEEDRVRRMLLSYRNLRLTALGLVRRYIHRPRQDASAHDEKGFVLGYAAALLMYAKSLKFIACCGPLPVVRAKLNEPDERFGIEAGFFDHITGTYCSLRYLLLFVDADRHWRRLRRQWRRPADHEQSEVAPFLAAVGQLRQRCWHLFWFIARQRIQHSLRGGLRSLFAPLRSTGWGAQVLLGHAVARLRTTLKYQPAIGPEQLTPLAADLSPGDLLFTRVEHKVTTALLPGFFGHVGIYVGRPEQLAALDLTPWPGLQAALAEMHSRPAPHGWVLEARNPGVVVQPLAEALSCDHVLALRPQLAPADLRAMLSEAFSHFGKPYDFDFDFSRSSHIVCSELVYRALQGRSGFSFDLVKRMGRYTLTVDDIVGQSLRDQARSPHSWQELALLIQWRDGLPALAMPRSAISALLHQLLPGADQPTPAA